MFLPPTFQAGPAHHDLDRTATVVLLSALLIGVAGLVAGGSWAVAGVILAVAGITTSGLLRIR